MALKNILAAIEAETENEAKKITAEGEKEITALNKAYAEKEKEQKENILKETKKEAEGQVKQAGFRLLNEKKSSLLKEKQEILDEVFALAARKIAARPEAGQVELLSKLIKKLPPSNEGKLVAVKNSVDLVKKARARAGSSLSLAEKTIPGQGGFVFISPKMEIDNRYETLANLARNEAETKVAGLLFP